MLHKAWNGKEEMPYCFPRSFIKFQGHTGQNITDFDPNWAFPDYRPVAAFKSLRFALFHLRWDLVVIFMKMWDLKGMPLLCPSAGKATLKDVGILITWIHRHPCMVKPNQNTTQQNDGHIFWIYLYLQISESLGNWFYSLTELKS